MSQSQSAPNERVLISPEGVVLKDVDEHDIAAIQEAEQKRERRKERNRRLNGTKS